MDCKIFIKQKKKNKQLKKSKIILNIKNILPNIFVIRYDK